MKIICGEHEDKRMRMAYRSVEIDFLLNAINCAQRHYHMEDKGLHYFCIYWKDFDGHKIYIFCSKRKREKYFKFRQDDFVDINMSEIYDNDKRLFHEIRKFTTEALNFCLGRKYPF